MLIAMRYGWGGIAYVKAAARDVKAYLASKGSKVLVGYSSVDGSPDFRGKITSSVIAATCKS